MILVDTATWINLFKGTNSLDTVKLKWLIQNSWQQICTTDLIYLEVLQGIPNEKDYLAIEKNLNAYKLVSPLTTPIYKKAINIYRTCRQKGTTIRSSIDSIIAATCLNNNLQLLTPDKDFQQIAKHFPLKLF